MVGATSSTSSRSAFCPDRHSAQMSDAPLPLIAAHGLQRDFGGGSSGPAFRLRFAPFTVPRGGLIAVVGRSGVGKTTLINMLAGVDQPGFANDGGALVLRFSDNTGAVLQGPEDAFPRARISNIFQRGHLLSNVAIGMNVAVPMALAHRNPSDDFVADMLRSVGLDDRIEKGLLARRPWQISGGQAQRVGIARALAREPEVIFADEPTSNLDEDARDQVMGRLEDWLAETGGTLILVSHDLDLIERHATRVFVLHRGTDSGPSVLREHLGARTSEALNAAMDAVVDPKSVDAAKIVTGNLSSLPQPNAATAQNRIASKLAMSELLAGRQAHGTPEGTGWRRRLHEATASWSGAVPILGFFSLLRAFSHWNTWIVSVLILVLAGVTTVAVQASVQRWGDVRTDPTNCGVLAEGLRAKAEPATPSIVAGYAARPWNTEMSEANRQAASGQAKTERRARADCTAGPAVFGRFDGYGARIGVLTASGDCSRRSAVNVLPLITEMNDPILATARITHGPAAGQSIQHVYRDFRTQGTARQVFLSQDFMAFMASKLQSGDLKVDVPGPGGTLCLSFPGGVTERFTLAGIVDTLPAPRIAPFQAYVTVTDYKDLLKLTDQDRYSTLKVYYDTGGFLTADKSADLEQFLDANHYRLVGDALKKSRALRAEAQNALILQISVGTVIALLFAAVVFQITLSYFERNAAQFAVLRTFGLSRSMMQRQGFLTMAYTLGFALLPILGLVGLVAVFGPFPLGEALTIGAGEAAVGAGIAAALAVVISAVAVAWATRSWWAKDRLLSEMIG